MSDIEEVYNDIAYIVEDEKTQHIEQIQEFMSEVIGEIFEQVMERIKNYMENL